LLKISFNFLLAGKVTGIVKRSSINNPGEDLDLPLFYLDTLTLATNNFSVDNMLGEGGFGPVYKVLIIKHSSNFMIQTPGTM